MRTWWMLLLLGACAGDLEGDEPGECEDGADNDVDGMFDCFDLDCAGAPVCLDDAPDTDADTLDTTPEDTLDPPATLCPTDVGWDGTEDRPPGPHNREIARVTAWLILPDTWSQAYDERCQDTTDPDWQGVFDGSDLLVDPELYNYVFFRIQDDCATAIKQKRCGEDYPDSCVDDELVYTLEEPAWVATTESVEAPVDPLLVPNCTLGVEQTPIVEDRGLTGTLTYERKVLVSGACPGNVTKNKNCVIRYSYDLEWAKAE